MSRIIDAWEAERLAYQQRYANACAKIKGSQENDTEFYQGKSEGAMLEMSYVLIEIFGLSCKQVEEVERNKGFIDADFD